MHFTALLGLAFHLSYVGAVPAVGPTVQLDDGTFTGKLAGLTHKFLGIPFAKPPVGNLRYRLPQTIPAYTGSHDATDFGPSCVQQGDNTPNILDIAGDVASGIVNTLFGTDQGESEDCLTVNVVRLASATASSNLPVLVWIFGGGFEGGDTARYDGSLVVSRSIALGSPVIYVSMNYRLAGFGFLAGQEVKDAGVGNLGLQDQREALRWVQRYIAQFGGDPTKVTIWGESAGAISVALQMLANEGNSGGLFRGAFMESGAPIPVGDITNGQKYYDAIVQETGCSSASDTLACLRTVSLASLKTAINNTPGIFSYQSLNLAWLPRADGVFLTDNPQVLVEQGKVANVPYVTGNCDDEGTLFALSSLNVTTNAEWREYISTIFFPDITEAQLDQISTLYPSDITKGSPFDTGILNALTPQFKRIAAFQGDAVFQAPRRWMLQNGVPTNPDVWSYIHKRFKGLPVLGSLHGSDILNSYGGGEMQDHLIATTLNPNTDNLLNFNWPRYDLQSRQILAYLDGLVPLAITSDTYRQDVMNYLTTVTLANPV